MITIRGKISADCEITELQGEFYVLKKARQ